MGKESTTFTAGHLARTPRGEGSKSPNFLMTFREKVLKTEEGVAVVGYMISMWTFS